ncbi:MAG: HPr family phosphocarrier protein [Lachnospiraceae bacterium]|jgi:catabolite repression HPr-like protein|nr:HPr family phosphocarrier protein [Lachnospiraceae bacterium]MBP5732520.1 HPr family phosphocarrier protein [Lachnospiraceae bacterium]MBQ6093969.1 HPr family phosphocarrier protein [Lachnospiraceae bacterium]MBR3470114.1 HPr family phosphocarrier protein [Lachnospiraceae bacterium]MCR5500254.1 HPr family phosphocarrier protein [Acetatifactor sp.]
MVVKDILVNLENGLEARPIALLVQEASKYNSKIYIQSKDRRVNAKSIMGMMTLALDNGDKLEVSADGDDEQVAVSGIEQFLSGK